MKTKAEFEKHIYCPECLTGSVDSEFFLVCAVCNKFIEEENEELVCIRKYRNGNAHTHYHKHCYEELSKETIKQIENARKRIKKGIFVSEEEARKRLNL